MIKYSFVFFILLGMISVQSVHGQTDSTVHKYVDESPRPEGGIRSFYQYIRSNCQYPEAAKDKGVSGRVMIRFVVELDGRLSEPTVIRSLDPDCDKEAIRLIKNAPKWIPGQIKGKPVRSEVVRPITF